MKIFRYSTLISTIKALSKWHDPHLDVLFVTQISSKCLFTMWTISSTHFSGVLNNIWMFGFVMQFQTQVIEKYTRTLVAHKFFFIFETRWDSSVNVFVMLNKIHCCIKFLITFGADNFYRFDWGTGMFGFKGQEMSKGIFLCVFNFPKKQTKKS